MQQPSGAGRWPSSAIVWRTCVREIAFVDAVADTPPGAAAWRNEAAYAHLLEVICGLHSPMVGETEVLHQFKVFTAALPPDRPALRELGQSLLADARTIRARHLIGLGSRSYGSAVRRYVGNAPRIALAGTGMLANDVLPFLIRSDRQLDLWGRRDAIDGVDPTVIYRRYDAEMTPVDEPAILVIAAPLSSADIARLAARYRALTLIVDLRAEGVEDPPPPVAPLLTLADVFAGVQEASRAVEARVAAAKDAIRQLARGYVTRAKLNPSGWHDLCA